MEMQHKTLFKSINCKYIYKHGNQYIYEAIQVDGLTNENPIDQFIYCSNRSIQKPLKLSIICGHCIIIMN